MEQLEKGESPSCADASSAPTLLIQNFDTKRPEFGFWIAVWRSEAVTVGIEDLVFNSFQESLIYCAESRHLLEGFGEKVHELMLLHQQQFRAITSGDPDCDRFDILIHMANEEKQHSKYLYIQHLETHGCSTYNDIYKG